MKKLLINIIISAVAIAVGYGAITLSFNLFSSFTGRQMILLLAAEMLIYFAVFSAFCITEHKNSRRKAEQRKHNSQIYEMSNTIEVLMVNNCDMVA